MRHLSLIIAACILLFPSRTHADEGMWLLNLVDQVNMDEMGELGLQLTAEQIYDTNHASLKDAIGALDYGSCTAALVSSEGLLFTNHHCGYDEVQYHSTMEKDYMKNGFWATSREEELPNEGKTITFLVRMEEVTDRIAPLLTEEMDPQTRSSLIRSISGEIMDEAIIENAHEASVHSMYNDNRFFLFITETFRDVRLVGAPPESIGNFGGDADNWEWPRHTGDFCIFRVYTGPDGRPADYSPNNIPLKSKHHLPISLKGYKPGDFTMVLGFPGRTDRYMTSWEVQELLDITHPNRIRIRGIKQEIMMEDMMADERVRMQYAAKYSSSANYWKYSIGQTRGLTTLNVVEKKRLMEEEFSSWVNKDETRRALYGEALNSIRDVVAARHDLKNAEQYLFEAVRYGGGMESVFFARNLEIMERVLVYADQYPGDVERVVKVLKSVAEDFYKDYNPATDRRVMTAMIELLIEDLDDLYLPSNILEVKEKYKGDAEKYTANYFKKSFLVEKDRYFEFLEQPSLKKLRKDPAYMAHKASRKHLELIGKLDDFDQQAERGSRLYMKGLMEMNPRKDYYADANSTLRLNYGTVGGYVPRDAVEYKYYTTLEGIMEKEDPDNFEFLIPGKLKELYAEMDYYPYGKNGVLNTCFLSDNDITGGSSGSPVINARGELIGLAFDGNWEAMSGDIAFVPDLQKCINVDIRYVLFIIDKFAGASHLIEELNLIR